MKSFTSKDILDACPGLHEEMTDVLKKCGLSHYTNTKIVEPTSDPMKEFMEISDFIIASRQSRKERLERLAKDNKTQ